VVATVAPIALRSGASGIAAILAGIVVMRLSKNEVAALAAGLLVATGGRALGFT
jgi:hypothetical protein